MARRQKTKPKAKAKPRRRVRTSKSGLLLLPAERESLKRYYAEQPLSCPLGCGGRLERVRVQRAGSDGGRVLFDCQSCSLRYEMEIPPATRTERRKTREALEQGGEPECPRHGARQRLGRAGRELVCSLCGVLYAKM